MIDLGDDPQIIVCAGPPHCSHVLGDGLEMPCPFCKIITCHPDGSETVQEPARQ